ncbi:unnamed protein product [Ectocarpus sp. CCAP 1310/34]|nr:unnamed protein product [Ectocarpus sp. CCAP 1310/34]
MDMPTPDVEGYKAGNTMACHGQRVSLIAANTPAEEGTSTLLRAFAFEVAAKVGAEYCHHDTAPEPMPSMALAAAKKAAAEHPGLCGVHHAHIIAAVRTEDVTSRSGFTAANKFRNQACYDGGMAMNTRGKGVQLKRADCFTHACRAVWPGNEEMEASVAFRETNRGGVIILRNTSTCWRVAFMS